MVIPIDLLSPARRLQGLASGVGKEERQKELQSTDSKHAVPLS